MNHLFKYPFFISIILILGFFTGCGPVKTKRTENRSVKKLTVIFDTDANNELDDQHALAYLLFSGNTFDLKGVTVNTTYNGGKIDEHYAEAERVLELCKLQNKIPLFKGANGTFDQINGTMDDQLDFDGSEAVNFIIEQAKMHNEKKLIIIAVGKLTNVALAIKKEPSISKNIRLVWLGANYPEPGEYNLENDISSMNFLLKSDVHFEMVMVRYGKPTGTDAVRITEAEAPGIMAGLGPRVDKPVSGRHGGDFYNFGDYSVNLFEHINYIGNPPARALYDMAAVAIVKNPDWAEPSSISSPIMVDRKWIEQPSNPRKIIIWENFDKKKILTDFYNTLSNYVLVN